MNEDPNTGFADRLKTAAAARASLVAKLRPKPTQTDPQPEDRREARAAELTVVRQERTEAKAARRQAAADAATAAEQARAAAEAAALQAKRGERKQRKALSNAESKAAREAKFAAYSSARK
jgi:hypothetical protein